MLISLTVPNRELPRSSNAEHLLRNSDFEEPLDDWSYDTGIFWSNNGGIDRSGALLMNPPEASAHGMIGHR